MKKFKKRASSSPELSDEATQAWDQITAEFDLDYAGEMILHNALTAFDRMREAQAIIAADGLISEDRFGQKRAHPATLIERDARSAMLANLRALGLDVLPLRDKPGRPPGR